MKIKVYGVNVWGPVNSKKLHENICVFLHQDLKDMGRPTPFSTLDIQGNELHSRIRSNFFAEKRIKYGEVELAKGDYIMLLPMKDIEEYGDQACGHMHYYDGEKLISVYSKEENETEEQYKSRKQKEENESKLKEIKEKYPDKKEFKL